MNKKDYLKTLELKSILQLENRIESILIIKNKYFVVKSLNKISIYLINTNKLKFIIPLNNEKEEYNFLAQKFIFDLKYKLRIINNEEKSNACKILTDKHFIEINFINNKWKIIKELKNGIFLSNLNVLTIRNNSILILDQEGKLKKELKNLKTSFSLYGLYEIKNKFLIINFQLLFIILDVENNYEMLYSKENCFYSHGYKHPYILDKQNIIFSVILNCYISDAEQYIFLNLNNFSEKLVWNASYENDYDSCKKLFIIHKFDNKKFLQFETTEFYVGKKWAIVELKGDHFKLIKKINDKELLGDNVYFLEDKLIITWDFMGTTIKFIHYE